MSQLFPGTEMQIFIHNNTVSQILLPSSAVLHVYYHFHFQSLKKPSVLTNNMGNPRPLIITGIKTNREIGGAPFNCLCIFLNFQKIVYQHQAIYVPCHNSCHVKYRDTVFLALENIL